MLSLPATKVVACDRPDRAVSSDDRCFDSSNPLVTRLSST